MADATPLLAGASSPVAGGNGAGKPAESSRRVLMSAVATLTLSILGRCEPLDHQRTSPTSCIIAVNVYCLADVCTIPCSSVLPLPFAFSRTGILLGLVTMLVVGFCNAHTCMLLLRAAGSTGHDSYEGVAEAIGGRRWKVMPAMESCCQSSMKRLWQESRLKPSSSVAVSQVATQVSLFLLLFGTLCGDFALLHDAALRAVTKLWLGDPPGMEIVVCVKGDVEESIYTMICNTCQDSCLCAGWLLAANSRILLSVLAVVLVFPLCCLRRMRSVSAICVSRPISFVHVEAVVQADGSLCRR